MDRVIDLLCRLYEFDVAVMSNHWMYIPFLIPAAMYLAFMGLKWWVLTMPVWLPFVYIVDRIPRKAANNGGGTVPTEATDD